VAGLSKLDSNPLLMSYTIKINSSIVIKNRHKSIYAFTNNENQGTGDYPLNLFKFCYAIIRQKLQVHNTTIVAPKMPLILSAM
jgi:hypothetical protein